MVKKVTKKEYERLLQELQKHNKLYFEENAPLITDYEYDLLVKEVEKIEKENPDWVPEDTPTRTVGKEKTKGFVQVQHAAPMLSLSNTYSKEELIAFIKRTKKNLQKTELPFCVELKLDGVAVSLRYEKGVLVRGLTRGDGKKGDDITTNLLRIKSIPKKLEGKFPPAFEVRGEVFIYRKNFLAINQKREELGQSLFANPRNAAAGSLKLLDPEEVEKRNLEIICYGIAEGEMPFSSQVDLHDFLWKLGLPVGEKSHFILCHTVEDILSFADAMEKEREDLPFEIDGIVVKVNDLTDHKILGATGKSVRWAVAYKFAPQQAETKIESIIVQVGRTGVLTPIANLYPTPLAGSVISRATLHNEEEIMRKDIRIGDAVLIEKGGDVIPKVVKVIREKRPAHTEHWRMPSDCPICHTKVMRREGEVAVRCPNRKGCGGQNERRIAFFVSKKAMNIDHLGPEIIKKLIDAHLISKVADIYRLTAEELLLIEGFKEKSTRNLLASIEKSKKVLLSRFIFALGIPYVGEQLAEILALESQGVEKLAMLSQEELCSIEGIGPKVAEAVVHYFSDSHHLEEIKELIALGIVLEKPKKISSTHPFWGKIFVLTGSLEEYTRSEAASLIKERGGKISNSVSKNTDYLLLGEAPGSKYEKAKELGIPILKEETFTEKL